MIDTLLQDVRFGLRQLRKSPAFTVAAVLTLALGIGANATVFTWLKAVIFNPLPGVDAGDLVSVRGAPPRAAASVSPGPISWTSASATRPCKDWQSAE